MTDLGLLEMAAKAAGYRLDWDDGIAITYDMYECGSISEWNPLEDDGDALRLAVRLHLKILIGEAWTADTITGKHRTMFRVSPDDEPCQYAATRRAIVRAAAEIGRNMK